MKKAKSEIDIAMMKMGSVFITWGDIRGGTLQQDPFVSKRVWLYRAFGMRGGDCEGATYGGNARFGRRSSSISPSLGGGIRFSGDQTLMGVFQGTTGLMSFCEGGVVDARRRGAMRRRHW